MSQLSSLRFRITGDNADVMRSLSQFQEGVKKTGHLVQEEITNKLKGAFAVGAVEEAIRRTGEWSVELTKTAQNIGVTVEELQAMRLATERAGVPVEKIFNYYDKLEAAANKALAGNKKLIDSFKVLGISTSELQHAKPDELLQKSLGGMSKQGGVSAAMNIFGTKELLNVQALSRQVGGKSFQEYAGENSNLIESGDSVKETARMWESFLEDFKSLALKLHPVVKALISIIDGVLKMVNGTIGSVVATLNPKTSWDERVLRGATMGRSIANFIPQTAGGLMSLMTLGHVKPNWKWVKSGQEAYGGALNERQYREAEGAGEAASTLASFGTGPIARALGAGAKGLSGAAGMAGAEGTAGRLGSFAGKLSGMGSEGIFGKLAGRGMNGLLERLSPQQLEGLMKDLGINKADVAGVKDAGALEELLAQRMSKLRGVRVGKFVNNWGGLLGIASAGAGSGLNDAHNTSLFGGTGGTSGGVNRTAMGNFGNMSNLFAGGSGNLNMGGVFGVDLQAKLLTLNQKTVTLLEKIVTNTNPMRERAESLTSNTSEGAVGN